MDDKVKERWDKLDGYEFDYCGEKYWLKVGRYPTGNGAVLAMHETGPECKITVNLPAEETKDHQFWVKAGSRGEEMASFLAEQDLVEPVGSSTSAGFVPAYAELWQLKEVKDV